MSTKHFVQFIEIPAIIAAFLHLFFFIYDHSGHKWAIISFVVICAFLVLIYFHSASRLRYFVRRLKRLFDGEPSIKWFGVRERAEPDMYQQMEKHSHLVFIGFTQKSLTGYLDKVLSTGNILNWTEVEVYFSSDQLGGVFEEGDFLPILRRSRQDIARELTAPSRSKQLYKLQNLKFYQYHALVGYSGSYFGNKSTDEPDVVYVVQSLPAKRGETKQALTFRIAADGTEKWNSAHKVTLEHYHKGLKTIASSQRSLGTFTPNIWDKSAMDDFGIINAVLPHFR